MSKKMTMSEIRMEVEMMLREAGRVATTTTDNDELIEMYDEMADALHYAMTTARSSERTSCLILAREVFAQIKLSVA